MSEAIEKKLRLVLAVKGRWFEEIKAGTKVFEYRLRNAHWAKRLAKPYEELEITLGYPKLEDTSRRLVFPWRGFVHAEVVSPEWKNKRQAVYAISLRVEVKELEVLQHAMGLNEYGRPPEGKGTLPRNRFVASPESADGRICEALVKRGLMIRREGSELTGGSPLYQVTSEGLSFVARESVPEPKLTRSQKRYEQFLEADLGCSFGEYLKMKEAG